ncbi:SGNH/GDSL hydrolase family protein [Paenibacillus nasutitermitis]|uniref:Uncharacterized protein n=1 Tax=Paenibacillus nasutitermitis TaxID=1652958 RepID=A0A916YS84_9BACL|nr:SGNH/GDSL hydrolase family protein [Paenibacillus nasutitermitis]GGD59043.1 hypothetical protein GCM10010911_16110 [Paenibacillus nasutitermitis]
MSTDVLPFLAKYAINLRAAQFPVLTARRRGHETTDLEIIMLGDSHGWGQGSLGYDVVLPTPFTHMAVPYSNGFFARVRKHVVNKYDWYQDAVIPGPGNHEDPIMKVKGISDMLDVEVTSPVSAVGFYSPSRLDQARTNLGYLAGLNKFGSKLLTMAPDPANGNEAKFYVDMKAYASKLYIGVLSGTDGGMLEISLRDEDEDRHQSDYPLSRMEGFPKVTRIDHGVHRSVSCENGRITLQKSVVLDTFSPDGDEEVVYCIDYGQKVKGRIYFSFAGAGLLADSLIRVGESPISPIVSLRGIMFDGNNIRNFSMGGHTVGQWLGDGTESFNDPSYPHMDELLRFVPFTPSLAIIQAPIVNEYLRQTPIVTFTANLTELLSKMNLHHNHKGNRKMDVLLFTSLGDKAIIFEGAPSAPVSYEDYYEALRQFASLNDYGFVDFEKYFRDCVNAGLLDYELLFDDNIHPGPYPNEFIGKFLAEIIDLIM